MVMRGSLLCLCAWSREGGGWPLKHVKLGWNSRDFLTGTRHGASLSCLLVPLPDRVPDNETGTFWPGLRVTDLSRLVHGEEGDAGEGMGEPAF